MNLRCPNEDCRQALYIEIVKIRTGINSIQPTVEMIHIDSDEPIRCPVCDTISSAKDWMLCFEDPLPFTYLEKSQLCLCGGEYIANVTPRSAIAGETSLSRLPIRCEWCDRLVSQNPTTKDISIEKLKETRGL